jgi:hypothetical protein
MTNPHRSAPQDGSRSAQAAIQSSSRRSRPTNQPNRISTDLHDNRLSYQEVRGTNLTRRCRGNIPLSRHYQMSGTLVYPILPAHHPGSGPAALGTRAASLPELRMDPSLPSNPPGQALTNRNGPSQRPKRPDCEHSSSRSPRPTLTYLPDHCQYIQQHQHGKFSSIGEPRLTGAGPVSAG